MLFLFWGAALGAGLGAIGSFWGGERRNKQQSDEAGKTRAHQTAEASRSMEFAGEQAANSMRFSERMRNTSWQAGVADMEAAGLNPALAYSMGGAGSPMGSAGSGATGAGAQATVEDTLSPAVSSAKHGMRLTQELKNMRQAEDTALATKYKLDQDARESRSREDMNDESIKGIRVANELSRYSLPSARNRSRLENTWFGKAAPYVDRLRSMVFGGGQGPGSLLSGGLGAYIGARGASAREALPRRR